MVLFYVYFTYIACVWWGASAGRAGIAGAGYRRRLPKVSVLTLIIIILSMLYTYAGQLNSFTHLRALLVLHDRGILAHSTSISGRYSSNRSHHLDTGTTARVLWLWH
jgi:hypothetical protein